MLSVGLHYEMNNIGRRGGNFLKLFSKLLRIPYLDKKLDQSGDNRGSRKIVARDMNIF